MRADIFPDGWQREAWECMCEAGRNNHFILCGPRRAGKTYFAQKVIAEGLVRPKKVLSVRFTGDFYGIADMNLSLLVIDRVEESFAEDALKVALSVVTKGGMVLFPDVDPEVFERIPGETRELTGNMRIKVVPRERSQV